MCTWLHISKFKYRFVNFAQDFIFGLWEDGIMAETRFMRTVEFGGYDRNDVIKRLEFLNTQVFDLKNELRETKLLMEEYKKGTDEEKAHETVLAGEKVKLTSLQVQNETASAKLKAAEEDNKKLSEELEALKAKCADMEKDWHGKPPISISNSGSSFTFISRTSFTKHFCLKFSYTCMASEKKPLLSFQYG